MKKILTSILVVSMCLALCLSLAACGGPTDEQTAKMNSLMTNYETLIKDSEVKVEKFKTYSDEYPDFSESYQTIKTSMDELSAQAVEIRTAYDENKDSFTEESAAEIIKSLETQMKSGDSFSAQLDNLLKTAEEAISQINAQK